jgi:hypothetical protein
MRNGQSERIDVEDSSGLNPFHNPLSGSLGVYLTGVSPSRRPLIALPSRRNAVCGQLSHWGLGSNDPWRAERGVRHSICSLRLAQRVDGFTKLQMEARSFARWRSVMASTAPVC